MHLSIHSTVSHDFLHHLLLSCVTIALSNEISVLDLGVWFTLLVVSTFVALSLAQIRCTVLGDQVCVLSEETMEERPTTITSLVHIVTGHEMLCGELWHVLTIFDLETVLSDLREGDGVARSTVALISVLVHEVVATDVTPVEVLGQLGVWDRVGISICFLILLSQFERLLEIGTFSKLHFADWLTAGLSQEELFLIAVGSVVGMMLLILARIGLPSEVHLVNSRNEQIGLITWDVLQMGVVSPVSLSRSKETGDLNVLLVWRWSTCASFVCLGLLLFLGIQLLLDEGDTFGGDFMAFTSDGLGDEVGVLISCK